MIDIVIPVYNDANGLFATLCSIGYQPHLPIGSIIIVDDCSTENNNYEEIIELFRNYYNIIYHKQPINRGPAAARNVGLTFAMDEYITFIDCGDTIWNNAIFTRVVNTIKMNPHVNMFSFAHNDQKRKNGSCDEIIYPSHNRLMGKVYKRSFLTENSIWFNEQDGYANEDIGFNMLCRLVCGDREIFECDEVFIRWTYNEHSLTRIDDFAFWYRAVPGAARNCMYAIERARELGVDEERLREKAYDMMAFFYFVYCGALNQRPELEPNVFEGCLYLYEHYIRKDKDFNPSLFLSVYNKQLLGLEENDPYFVKFPSFTVLDFLNILENKLKEEKSDE